MIINVRQCPRHSTPYLKQHQRSLIKKHLLNEGLKIKYNNNKLIKRKYQILNTNCEIPKNNNNKTKLTSLSVSLLQSLNASFVNLHYNQRIFQKQKYKHKYEEDEYYLSPVNRVVDSTSPGSLVIKNRFKYKYYVIDDHPFPRENCFDYLPSMKKTYTNYSFYSKRVGKLQIPKINFLQPQFKLERRTVCV